MNTFLRHTSIFFIFISIQLNIFSQNPNNNRVDNQYYKFKKEFEEEFNLKKLNIDENKEYNNRAHTVFNKIKIPDWAQKIPQTDEMLTYIIGISDPNMEKDSALQLAKIRAKTIYSLLNSCKITSLTDYYNNEKKLSSGDKIYSLYQQMNELSVEAIFHDDSYSIVQQNYNENKEAIVLLAFKTFPKKEKSPKTFKCLANTYIAYKNINNKDGELLRLEIIGGEVEQTNQPKNFFQYIVKRNNKGISVHSNFSGKNKSLYYSQFGYKTNHQTDEDIDLQISYPLDYGLWQAFITAVINQMISTETTSASVSHLNDNFTTINQDIKRTVITRDISIIIKGIHINSNKLFLETE